MPAATYLALTEQQRQERVSEWLKFLEKANNDKSYLEQLKLVAKFSVQASAHLEFHVNVMFNELIREQQNRMLPFYHDFDEDSVLVYCDPNSYGNNEVRIETEELMARQCDVLELLGNTGIISICFVAS